jgi:hypothetical protein
MSPFFRLLAAEGMKLRRSPTLKLVWILPLLFLGLEFLILERPALGLRTFPPGFQALLEDGQAKLVVGLWGGFFHPLVLALLPALVFRPEHRGKTWRHLHAMPVSRQKFFLAKAMTTLFLSAAILALIGLLLMLEREILGKVNPLLELPFHGMRMAKVLGWLWLGSLPALAVYLWVSGRINSLAVPVVFGSLGVLLAIALTGQEMDRPWHRDLNPWVLPYAAAERVIHTGPHQQEAHMGAKPFLPEPGWIRAPSGRKYKVYQNIPDELVFPPPPPTPVWLLATFSSFAGFLLLVLGYLDAGWSKH